jgi:ABC-type sugar transport system permease subunit
MLVLAFFIIAPAAQLFMISLTNYSPGLQDDFVGIGNYVDLLREPDFRAAALRNIVYVICVVSMQVLIGLGIAVLLDNPLPARSIWMALLIAPFAVSSVVAVVSWKYLLDPSFGLINYVVTSFGLPAIPWFTSPVTAMLPIMIVAIWRGFSFVAIILFAALRAIPAELSEAARIDGATAVQTFFLVRLPLIMPTLSIVALLQTILAVREFDIVQTMTRGGPGTSTELLSNFLYRSAFGNFYFGMGAAVGFVMLFVTLLLASGIIRRNFRESTRT